MTKGKGRIHSLETTGLVDGPGIRFVVFLQGCPLRCKYCHNPDTWNTQGGEEMEVQDLMDRIKKYKTYINRSGGGVTFSGGEPLMQPEFLGEMLKDCRAEGIHTALDTSGFGKGNYDEILAYTDLVILDLKHYNDLNHYRLTGSALSCLEPFRRALERVMPPMWIRHVVVPGITDSPEHIAGLRKYIETFQGVEKIELLPYHTMGISKYHNLNIDYPLEKVVPMDKEKMKLLQSIIVGK